MEIHTPWDDENERNLKKGAYELKFSKSFHYLNITFLHDLIIQSHKYLIVRDLPKNKIKKKKSK